MRRGGGEGIEGRQEGGVSPFSKFSGLSAFWREYMRSFRSVVVYGQALWERGRGEILVALELGKRKEEREGERSRDCIALFKGGVLCTAEEEECGRGVRAFVDRASEGMEDDSCSRRPRLGDNWMREGGEVAVQWRAGGRPTSPSTARATCVCAYSHSKDRLTQSSPTTTPGLRASLGKVEDFWKSSTLLF